MFSTELGKAIAAYCITVAAGIMLAVYLSGEAKLSSSAPSCEKLFTTNEWTVIRCRE